MDTKIFHTAFLQTIINNVLLFIQQLLPVAYLF